MNRKNFLSSVLPLTLSVGSIANIPLKEATLPFFAEGPNEGKTPPSLKKGDLIGITCPSGKISFSETLPAMRQLQQWGFNVATGSTVGARDFDFAGSDEERTKDLQVMLDNPSIKAILLGRGGYGAVRIIDRIDFKKFRAAPKWILGFSDATVFHCHINRQFGIPTIHSKMCNSFPDDWQKAEPLQKASIDSIRKCLLGEKMTYEAPADTANRYGIAEGELVGGNLSILESLAATKSDLDTDGKILFFEDTEEYLYNIDRMVWNLKRSGKFRKLKGLIIGGFTHVRPDDPGDEFGKTIQEIVMEKVQQYPYPVCFNFPVGHQLVNYALKCGVRHRLTVTQSSVHLQEV